MRSTSDYECIAYMSAAENNLIKLDVEQNQGLRIYSGVFRTSPDTAVQVEMGELPLRIRRAKLMLAYWVTLRGVMTHTLRRQLYHNVSIMKPTLIALGG